MASLLLFNPENDLALAAGTSNYTPPAAAVKIRAAGALLPMWFAKPGDFILAPPELADKAREMRERYGIHGEIFTTDKAPEITKCIPWGWSAYAARLFRAAGIADSILPDDKLLYDIRQLSHRRTSISILKALSYPLLPIEAFTVEQAVNAVDSFSGEAYLKYPWSGSGRGVFPVSGITDQFIRLAEGAIRRQGSVIIEPRYTCIKDFAMLFYCSDAKAHFHGLSFFKTQPGGAYSGNIIAPQSYIAEKIGLPHSELDSLKHSLEEALTNCVASAYNGPVGIDMMIAERNGLRLTVPCIEINLRYTMGFIAQTIAGVTRQAEPSLLRL
ncbi:MAG: hypothetical protein K2K08_08390 [Paramuribaculum sp.]|nr:hypothetical protein [Paramuribaculum sp.]